MKTTIKKLMSTGFLSVAATLLLIGCAGPTEEEIFEKILTKHLSDKGYVLSTYVTFPYTTRNTDYGWRSSVSQLNPFVEAGLLGLEKKRRKVRERGTRLQESFIFSLTPLGEKYFVARPDTVGFRVADIKLTSIKKIYNDIEFPPDSEAGKNNRNVICAATLNNLAPWARSDGIRRGRVNGTLRAFLENKNADQPYEFNTTVAMVRQDGTWGVKKHDREKTKKAPETPEPGSDSEKSELKQIFEKVLAEFFAAEDYVLDLDNVKSFPVTTPEEWVRTTWGRPAESKQLEAFAEAGLLTRATAKAEKDGRELIVYSLTPLGEKYFVPPASEKDTVGFRASGMKFDEIFGIHPPRGPRIGVDPHPETVKKNRVAGCYTTLDNLESWASSPPIQAIHGKFYGPLYDFVSSRQKHNATYYFRTWVAMKRQTENDEWKVVDVNVEGARL